MKLEKYVYLSASKREKDPYPQVLQQLKPRGITCFDFVSGGPPLK